MQKCPCQAVGRVCRAASDGSFSGTTSYDGSGTAVGAPTVTGGAGHPAPRMTVDGFLFLVRDTFPGSFAEDLIERAAGG